MSESSQPLITAARVVGGHDGRAEILVEITYPNGGTTDLSLDEEACTASLDRSGLESIEQLVGRPWNDVLPALTGSAMTRTAMANPASDNHSNQ